MLKLKVFRRHLLYVCVDSFFEDINVKMSDKLAIIAIVDEKGLHNF